VTAGTTAGTIGETIAVAAAGTTTIAAATAMKAAEKEEVADASA